MWRRRKEVKNEKQDEEEQEESLATPLENDGVGNDKGKGGLKNWKKRRDDSNFYRQILPMDILRTKFSSVITHIYLLTDFLLVIIDEIFVPSI